MVAIAVKAMVKLKWGDKRLEQQAADFFGDEIEKLVLWCNKCFITDGNYECP